MPAKINKRIKRLIFIFAFLILLFSSITQPLVSTVSAQSTWYNQSPTDFYLKVFDTDVSQSNEIFGERYTAAQVQWIFWSLGSNLINSLMLGHSDIVVCALNQEISINCAQTFYDTFKDFNKIITFNENGGAISNLASTIVTNPVSGVSYVKNLISKFNPVTPVNAQGFGFNTGANAILKLWQISRNISFSFLIVVVVAMAFMIMFRVKISPQVVITIQSAIPKVVVALILITFSYAIAGFLIDLMYVIIGLLAAFITGAGLSDHTASKLFTEFTTGENAIGLLFEFWFAFMSTAIWSIASSINPFTWIGGILILIFSILFIVVAIVSTIKIIVLIFKNFVMIVLTIVTGPLEILFGTLTQGAGFGPWIRKLISYLAVYPVMILLFFIAFLFLAQSLNVGLFGTIAKLININFMDVWPFNPALDVVNGNIWDPPLSTWLVSGDALMWAIVAYVTITLIPKTLEIVQGLISGKPFAYGTAVGEATGAVKSAGGYGFGLTGIPAYWKQQQAFMGQKSLLNVQRMAKDAVDQREMKGKKTPDFIKKVIESKVPEPH